MKRLQYTVRIQRSAAEVHDKMLGLSDKATYEEWTAVFSSTSSYEGTWDQGSKMLFVSLDKNGDQAGMISRILEHTTNKFVSIQHYGMLKSGEEITQGPEVEGWSGALENYSFEEDGGMTLVTIDIDAAEEHKEYMDNLYPAALQKLKEVCERS